MQLADTKIIYIKTNLIPHLKRVSNFQENYWICVTKLGNFIFNLLPQEVKNIFQVSLQFTKTNANDDILNVKDVTKNFIIISPRYCSVADAIRTKFGKDVSKNLNPDYEPFADSSSDFDKMELLTLPDILIFAINRQGHTPDSEYFNDSYMKLDFELEISLPDARTAKYFLQSFTYRTGEHHLSFVLDQGNWYRHNDTTVLISRTRKHLNSLEKNGNTTCTFAFYVRSDTNRSTDPEIPDHIMELAQKYFTKGRKKRLVASGSDSDSE